MIRRNTPARVVQRAALAFFCVQDVLLSSIRPPRHLW
jgi:hypothetical protein